MTRPAKATHSRPAAEKTASGSTWPTQLLPILQAALIVALVIFIYWPAINGGFVLDDEGLLTEYPIFRVPDGLYRIWFTTDAPDYWPLTYTGFWVEWHLFEKHTTGYHIVNLTLHIAASLLLWRILRKLKIPGAYLAALLFAVHPVNVQSVAWIIQLKNILAMVWFLLAIWFYFKSEDRFAAAGTELSHASRLLTPNSRRLIPDLWYCLSLLAFLFALLSKGSTATLPAILLVIIWWQRGITKRDVVRLIPFFLLAAAFVVVNIWFQAHANIEVIRHASPRQRILGAGAVIWFYLYKALAPFDLAIVYPPWHIDPANPLWWLPLIAAVAVTIALWRARQSRLGHPLLFAWAYFSIALIPVMGLTDVGFMRFSLVSDHYQHIAIIGVVTLVAATVCTLRNRVPTALTDAIAVLAALAVAGLAALAHDQAGLYHDAITYYKAALEKNPGSWLLHGNLGDAYVLSEEYKKAIPELREALRINPDCSDAHQYLGKALARTGHSEEAIAEFREANELRPNNLPASGDLAGYLLSLGRKAEAIAEAQRAIDVARSRGDKDSVEQIEKWISVHR
jgi:tetratricopeptide (TPR) repeat protein